MSRMTIKYKEVKTISEFIDYIKIRADVFILEQGFAPGWEPDEDDKVSKHFIALDSKKVIATGRYREIKKGEIKIERMAVRKDCRGKGIGNGILSYMINDIKKHKPKKIWTRSQPQAMPFYDKFGFVKSLLRKIALH